MIAMLLSSTHDQRLFLLKISYEFCQLSDKKLNHVFSLPRTSPSINLWSLSLDILTLILAPSFDIRYLDNLSTSEPYLIGCQRPKSSRLYLKSRRIFWFNRSRLIFITERTSEYRALFLDLHTDNRFLRCLSTSYDLFDLIKKSLTKLIISFICKFNVTGLSPIEEERTQSWSQVLSRLALPLTWTRKWGISPKDKASLSSQRALPWAETEGRDYAITPHLTGKVPSGLCLATRSLLSPQALKMEVNARSPFGTSQSRPQLLAWFHDPSYVPQFRCNSSLVLGILWSH